MQRLHTAVPSLWMGSSPMDSCTLRLSADLLQPSLHPALDVCLVFSFFVSQSLKLFRKHCIIPWCSEQMQAKGVCLDRMCPTPQKPPKLPPSWCGGFLFFLPSLMLAKCYAWRVQHQRAMQKTPALFRLCCIYSRVCWLRGLPKRRGITSIPAQM